MGIRQHGNHLSRRHDVPRLCRQQRALLLFRHLHPFLLPDNGIKLYTDFANFTTPVQSGVSHYYDAYGKPYHTYYDYWSYGRTTQPLALPISPDYYNEHGSLSYNHDLFVMTRTDSAGYSMIIRSEIGQAHSQGRSGPGKIEVTCWKPLEQRPNKWL